MQVFHLVIPVINIPLDIFSPMLAGSLNLRVIVSPILCHFIIPPFTQDLDHVCLLCNRLDSWVPHDLIKNKSRIHNSHPIRLDAKYPLKEQLAMIVNWQLHCH